MILNDNDVNQLINSINVLLTREKVSYIRNCFISKTLKTSKFEMFFLIPFNK